MDNQDLLWGQYQQHVELFKFYMELTVKFNVFFYAVTGAVISYVLAQYNSNPLIQYALLLPLLMSVFFGIFFVYGAVLMRVLRKDIAEIGYTLNLRVAPDVGVLTVLLSGFSVIYLFIAVGCGVLLCKL